MCIWTGHCRWPERRVWGVSLTRAPTGDACGWVAFGGRAVPMLRWSGVLRLAQGRCRDVAGRLLLRAWDRDRVAGSCIRVRAGGAGRAPAPGRGRGARLSPDPSGRIAFIHIHATRSDWLAWHVREAQDRAEAAGAGAGRSGGRRSGPKRQGAGAGRSGRGRSGLKWQGQERAEAAGAGVGRSGRRRSGPKRRVQERAEAAGAGAGRSGGCKLWPHVMAPADEGSGRM